MKSYLFEFQTEKQVEKINKGIKKIKELTQSNINKHKY